MTAPIDSAGAGGSSLRVRVGALLGVAVLALVALVILARSPIFLDGRHEHTTTFRNVAGLNVGDEVRYGGVRVGAVTRLVIDSANPSRIRVEFRVRRGTPVRTDTRASLAQLGLLGQPYLALEPGAPDAPPLPAGAPVASAEGVDLQGALRRLALSLERADTVFAALDRLARANPLARLDTTLARADTLVRGATTGSERLLARLDEASRRLALLLARSERLVGVIDTAVAEARPGLSLTQREALETMRETRALVAELREAMGESGGVERLVQNLNSATENVARLTARLERDPASLLRRRAQPSKPTGPAVRD